MTSPLNRQKQRYRHSIRLKGHDYAQNGAYYVTICAFQRQCLFGDIVDGQMISNKYGKIVEQEWLNTPTIRPNILLDEYVVMPNHFHGIIHIQIQDVPKPGPVVGAHSCAPLRADRIHRTPKSLGSIVAGFKSTCTKQINELRAMPGIPVWQRNYYEHIIRNDVDLNRIREYIQINPASWITDEENPECRTERLRK